MRSLTFIASLGLILVAACGGEEFEPELEADLEIGTATPTGVGFIAIDDGETVELIPGSQGGYHVWTGLRINGAMGELYLEREARVVSDGTLILRAQEQYIDVPEAAMDDWWERDEAAPSFMCPAPIGITIYDTELEFTVRLVTPEGELLAQDKLAVTPVCPTGMQEATCRTLCDG